MKKYLQLTNFTKQNNEKILFINKDAPRDGSAVRWGKRVGGLY